MNRNFKAKYVVENALICRREKRNWFACKGYVEEPSMSYHEPKCERLEFSHYKSSRTTGIYFEESKNTSNVSRRISCIKSSM